MGSKTALTGYIRVPTLELSSDLASTPSIFKHFQAVDLAVDLLLGGNVTTGPGPTYGSSSEYDFNQGITSVLPQSTDLRDWALGRRASGADYIRFQGAEITSKSTRNRLDMRRFRAFSAVLRRFERLERQHLLQRLRLGQR